MPGQPVVLDTFGGLVTTARPEDLPEGASPRNNDVDFIVGRFIQRPGCEGVYALTQSEYGPKGGTIAEVIDTSSASWTNPSNILLEDGSFATTTLSGPSANYSVASVSITQGGYYTPSQTPTAVVSGAGAGAIVIPTVETITPSDNISYQVVTGATILTGGIYTGSVSITFTGASAGNNATGTTTMQALPSTFALSDILRVRGLSLAVPSTYQVNGIGVNVKGLAPSGGTIFAQLIKNGAPVGDVDSVTLPATDAYVDMGSPLYLWSSTWLNTDIDSDEFGVDLWVASSASGTISLDYAEIVIYGTPQNANFNGICETNLNQTDQISLALDANGLTWKEDVTNNPFYLATEAGIPAVMAGAYLKGVDANGVAFMAYSDLTQGTSQPMQYNGSWCDRITQVGPGAAPTFTPQQTTSNNFSITNISQPALFTPLGGTYFLQSSGPGSTTPGNVVTIYYGDSTNPSSPQDTDLVAAFNSGNAVYVWLTGSGFPTSIGPVCVQITSVGEAQPPTQPRNFYYFTYVVSSSAYTYYHGSGNPSYLVTWNRSLATLNMSEPVPGLMIGNKVTIAGNTVSGYNSAWSITQTLNSGEMEITETSVTSGVATYNYAMQSGVAPTAGELVTITNTTNANGALNLANATIATATGGETGSFTIATSISTDYPFIAESGSATTAGTIFTFDPGIAVVNTSTTPIYGAGTGGTLTFSNASSNYITAGVKQGSVFFITRNGAVTRPAPPVTFTVPQNCGTIIVSHIPVGSPNIVARGITFTESGQNQVAGANFYYYDTATTYYVNGTKYTSDALIVPDNTSTSASFSFSDSVLLASDEIDIPGNNYFNLIELGNPAWMFQYATRMLYGLCQTKIQNFLNMSFDGGYFPVSSPLLPTPTGWTSPSNGNIGTYTVTGFSISGGMVTFLSANSLAAGYPVVVTGLTTGTYLNNVPFVVETSDGVSFTAPFVHANIGSTPDSGKVSVTSSSIGLVDSLDFGNAFRITNYGAAAWTDAQVLFQSAYQDYLNVNIIQPNTAYSVRVKARSLNADGQIVTIQLPTYSNSVFSTTLFGSESFTFNRGNYEIQTAPLIAGNGLTTVPSLLQLAVGVSALAVGAGVEIDRIEIYPTNRPVDTTTIWTSYAGKFESVDIVTGSLGVGGDNSQPANAAFEILEQLYIEKAKSLSVTQDSPNYEPNNWKVSQASDRAGAVGPNAFDEGEEFTLSASRNGVYYFDGGKPQPVLRELQNTAKGLNLWDSVNWNAGKTIWIRNDLNNRRLMIGIPMTTPNPWLPLATPATPTSPNIILMCNYSGCPTGPELAESSEVHMTMFGDLKALDMRRKWSLWQIPCPVAEFVPRDDGFSAPLFLCNGIASGKIYQLTPGAAVGGQNTDDGAAINWSYVTYGFAKAKQGQQIPGLGALRKIWYYMAVTMEGVGKVAGKLYSNSLGALPRNTFTIPLSFTLSSPQQNDQECVLEIGGQRLFIEFKSVGSGGYAEVGPVMLEGEMDKVSPHRGVSS